MMFSIFGKKNSKNNSTDSQDYSQLLNDLEKVYKLNRNYDNSDSGYLSGKSELEKAINKVLELKNAQIREQFLINSQLIEFVTGMVYVKDMVDSITYQKEAISEISNSSEEMSRSIEEIASFVQTSLTTTLDAVNTSNESMDTINQSFKYISQSFDEITNVKSKMQDVVKATKEIEAIVNIINDVAEQTNLLALNASIEAARSGEAGKGFAVVAAEIKRLADDSKKSTGFIRDLITTLRENTISSDLTLNEAVKVFIKGKDHIDSSISSIDKIESSVKEIGVAFEYISANVEEQSATTQEVTARLSEINTQTQILNDVCMKTGEAIFTLSTITENSRVTALPYFKDLKGNEAFKPIIAEHLLWKWKAYNATCGFVKLVEDDIGEHTTCTMGRYLEVLNKSDKAHDTYLTLYEPHKKIHTLSKSIIRSVNTGATSMIDEYLHQLDDATDVFIKGVSNIKM